MASITTNTLPTKKRQNAQLTETYAASLMPEGDDVTKKRAKDKETLTTVCIIGPASVRHVNFASNTPNKLTSDVFDAMVKHTTRWIEVNLLKDPTNAATTEKRDGTLPPLDWSSIHLSSSGAAWCDHVAIAIYLDKRALGATLTLHLPCDFVDGEFFDNGKRWSGLHNPGGIVNKQHAEFAAVLGRSTLAEINQAKSLGATLRIVEKGGFFACSQALIHECDELIAFGWAGKDDEGNQRPSTPGTKYTWTSAPKWTRKHFVNLNTLQ